MSRDLSYRVWDKEKKEYSDKPFSLDQYGLLSIQDEDGYWEEANDRYIIEFSTGLLDRNGKEICEGDILETCCGKTEVYFDDELLMYKIKVRHGGTMPLVSKKSKRHFDYEIIGNIHENPELLGGEERKKGQIVDAMVKLTTEEIARLVKDHIEIVEALASKFDGHYLSISVQVKDYREFLDGMDESLKRAEELMEILDSGSKNEKG